MRSLTAAEARVIHALLVAADVPERVRERWSGVPRATFLAVRKRAFAHGWLTSRYVPDPAALGFDRVSLVLDQPFSDHLAEAVSEAREDPGTVLAWSSPETVLSVRFGRSSSRAPSVTGGRRHRFEIVATEPARQLPIYFDFEGAWSLWASGLALVSYPAGLVAPTPDGRPRGPRTRPGRSALEELLSGPDGASPEAGGPLRLSDTYLPRRHRALVRTGTVRRRAFPNLGEIPPGLDGGSIASFVFVHGTLRGETGIEALLSAVLRDARVRPFLLASDDRAALLGLLAPMPSRLRGIGRPLIDVLGEVLESISVVREPIATLFPLLDHRYDRLAGPSVESAVE